MYGHMRGSILSIIYLVVWSYKVIVKKVIMSTDVNREATERSVRERLADTAFSHEAIAADSARIQVERFGDRSLLEVAKATASLALINFDCRNRIVNSDVWPAEVSLEYFAELIEEFDATQTVTTDSPS